MLGPRRGGPSTIGTFLRSFSWGHCRQVDKVAGEVSARAWAAGSGPGGAPVTIDVDTSICETYGLAKQGGSRFSYAHVRGYHPLFATIVGTAEVVHSRLRGGPSHTARGAASFLAETFARARSAGASGPLVMRADSGFYNAKVVGGCRSAGVGFSVTTKMSKGLHKIIEAIPETAWKPIPYFLADLADVAETSYQAFGTEHGVNFRRADASVEPRRAGAGRVGGGYQRESPEATRSYVSHAVNTLRH